MLRGRIRILGALLAVLLTVTCHAQSIALHADGSAWVPVEMIPDALGNSMAGEVPCRPVRDEQMLRLTDVAAVAGGTARWNEDRQAVEITLQDSTWSFYTFARHDFLSLLDGLAAAQRAGTPPAGARVVAERCTRVIDGDTIELADGEHVRYIGMNTAETNASDPQRRKLAQKASRANRALVLARSLDTVLDVEARDRYGRLLGYVYVGDLFVNAALVASGYAHVATYPPNVRHVDLFTALQADARRAGRGMWGTAADPDPANAVADAQQAASAATGDRGGVTVYITKTGECYHREGCSSLRRSKIEISLAEAKDRGYRPCRKCEPPG